MHPVLSLGQNWTIPTYYVVIVGAVCLSLLWLSRRLRTSPLSRSVALDLSLVIMLCGFIGGRLLHVVYESPDYYLEDPWRIFYFWQGGFVFYGGAALSALGAWLFLRWKDREHLLEYFDLFAPPLALSYAIGRLGCLMAGCCYGRSCELPWAISGRHPAPLYASLWEVGVLLILLGIEGPSRDRRGRLFVKKGAVFYLWMILHGLGRLLMESFRDDFRGPRLGLSLSSWISWMIVLAGLFLLLRKPTGRGSATSTD